MTKRHPSSKPRPGTTPDSDDAFIAGILELSHWARANQKTLTIFGVVLAVIIVGVLSFSKQRARQLEQAGLELERIQATMGIGDPDAAKVGLSQYLEQYANTPYAGEAALVLGQLYLESGQPELALRSLDRADISVRDPLGPQAFGLRARALEMAGDQAEAEEIYLQIADDASMSFERHSALANAARLRETQGDWAGAAELYGEILADLDENAADRGLYEMRLAEAETRAGE